MQTNEQELTNLIARITEEVTAVLADENKASVKTNAEPETIALVSGYVTQHQKAAESIRELCGEQTKVYLLNDAIFPDSGFSTQTVSTREEENALLDELADASCVLLVAPSLRQLKNVSEGNDDGYTETAILKAILWGKQIGILLDFDPPQFKRGSFFEKLVDSIDALTGMGVQISAYPTSKNKRAGRSALVTEIEIVDAHRNGQKTVYIEKNAIVTPLARDKANELKINIE